MISKEKTTPVNKYQAFLYLLLGSLTAFGPFVNDMYLPTLPSMTGYFHTTVSMVQLGLTFSMFGLAFGQLVFGPLSDKLGRRLPLLASMIIFIFSTALCIIAPNIEYFLALRLLQGIAGAGGIVIARSIAVDAFSASNLATSLAIIGAINGVAPVIAPIIGGFCSGKPGWKGVFEILLAIGILLLLMCFNFRESLPLQKRSSKRWSEIASMYKQVLGRKRFLYYVLQCAASYGILFGNIASSPFIVQTHYAQSAFVFSLCFAINSLAICIGSVLSVRFSKPQNCVKTSCIGMVIGSLMINLVMNLGCPLWIYEVLVTLTCLAMGMTFTASLGLSLGCVRDMAGTGAAVQGAMGFIVGGIVSPLIGLGDVTVTTPIVMLVSALISTIFYILAERYPQESITNT